MDRIEREKEITHKMIYLYGPPGSGKSSLGRALAEKLAMPFTDLDDLIEAQTGMSIPGIFAAQGEAGFRQSESLALDSLQAQPTGVVALGGGTLLNPHNRARAEATGVVLCLYAPLEILQARLLSDASKRPLLTNQPQPNLGDDPVPTPDIPSLLAHPLSPITDNQSRITNPQSKINPQKLASLLASRSTHYASFPLQLDVSQLSLGEAAWEAQLRLGSFRVSGMGPAYDVRVQFDGLDKLGELLQVRELQGPVALVSDANVAGLYAPHALASLRHAGYTAELLTIPAGEEFKTMTQVQELWAGFLATGLERSSTVVALGGGVVGDLAGFAASTYLRGIKWVANPTSLLAMIDASLGGKTGADLPQGKNLVGAFHPPALVLADPRLLRSLPEAELRSGMAEVVKHGLIGDSRLFDLCAQGWESVLENIDEIVRRGMAVKIQVIQADPYEQGPRAALNLGHTLGHALELASGYQVRHGEGVAIGMVAAARLSERLGLAEPGLAERIRAVLSSLGLPVEVPSDLDHAQIIAAMGLDKKRRAGKVRLALPVRIGEVRFGIAIDDLGELLNVKR
jgi:shikimate kinase / 3-dehydroquinate synthase